VRSDNDLFTYGYRFKPWRGPSIAEGKEILAYIDEVIAEDDLHRHIRYRHRCHRCPLVHAGRRPAHRSGDRGVLARAPGRLQAAEPRPDRGGAAAQPEREGLSDRPRAHLGVTDPRLSLFSASSVQHSSGVVISPVAPADPVVTGGRIWTKDPARPWAEALAATNGLIAAVGDAAKVSALVAPVPRNS
jgi:hypothetical protein